MRLSDQYFSHRQHLFWLWLLSVFHRTDEKGAGSCPVFRRKVPHLDDVIFGSCCSRFVVREAESREAGRATIVTFEVLTLSYLSLCVAVAFNADTPIQCCKMREAKKTLTYGI